MRKILAFLLPMIAVLVSCSQKSYPSMEQNTEARSLIVPSQWGKGSSTLSDPLEAPNNICGRWSNKLPVSLPNDFTFYEARFEREAQACRGENKCPVTFVAERIIPAVYRCYNPCASQGMICPQTCIVDVPEKRAVRKLSCEYQIQNENFVALSNCEPDPADVTGFRSNILSTFQTNGPLQVDGPALSVCTVSNCSARFRLEGPSTFCD